MEGMGKIMFADIYQNKTVLVTGHAGFKGSWLSFWLKQMGAKVVGYSLLPDTEKRLYDVLDLEHLLDDSLIADIRDEKTLEAYFAKHQPDIVFHLAAQPIVRLSYQEPVMTYATNVMGTLNVLEAARKTPSVKAFVNITTDKCYENKERAAGYREDEAFGGYDMYSSSKACSEILSASYRRSFLSDGKPFALATARAGNVIGGGDWAQDRLIPDCINAINKNEAILIRNPKAIRPWQFVLEPLSGYLLLGEKLLTEGAKFAQAFNFGPKENETLSVMEVCEKICKLYKKGFVELDESNNPHEAKTLTLNINKAKDILGWEPVYTNLEAIDKTVLWYKNFYEKNFDIYEFTINQIKEYGEKIKWSKNYVIK